MSKKICLYCGLRAHCGKTGTIYEIGSNEIISTCERCRCETCEAEARQGLDE